jgi:hypothetical protein
MTKDDIPELVRLSSESNNPLPNPFALLASLVVEDEGKIIAFGAIEKLIEIVFVPDLYQSKRKVVEAMKLLLEEAVKASKMNNIKTVHAFTDEQFASLLLKHFDFRLRNQTPLTLEIGNGEQPTEKSSSD